MKKFIVVCCLVCGLSAVAQEERLPMEVVCKSMAKMNAAVRRALAEVKADAVTAEAFPTLKTPWVNFGELLPVSVDISGAERIYLGATGSYGGGHAYWGEPTLFDAEGMATPLTDLSPRVFYVGWDELRVDPAGQNKAPAVGPERMKFGFFAHVDSCAVFQLDKKFVRLEAKVGIREESATHAAKVAFSVASKPSEQQLERFLNQAQFDPQRSGQLAEAWKNAVSDGPLAFWDWVRVTDMQVVVQAIEKMLAQCGDEPKLTARLAALKETKPEGNEPEWFTLYLDTLECMRVYVTFDGALEQMDAVCAFMASEGVSTEAFSDEIAAVKKQAAIERGKGREAMEAFGLKVTDMRRKILFSHPTTQFRDLLIDVRHVPTYHHNVDQYLGRNNRTAPGLLVLENWKSATPSERWLTRDALPPGCTQHPDLSYDGTRVIFGFCDHTEPNLDKRRFLIYEATLDGTSIRQITGTKNDPWQSTRRDSNHTVIIEDFDPHYLPDGTFVFTSTRSQNIARCHAGRNAPAFLIHRGHLDGTHIQALSWGEANELDPAVLHDGRIIYNRWEYVNRHDCLFHKLWTMKPDGTSVANFYGNLTPTPQSITEPRPIPNSNKIIATATAHHSFTAGCIILIDPLLGTDGPDPVTRLTPEAKYPESEGFDTDTYMAPLPLTERLFLAAWAKGPHTSQGHTDVKNAYALYLVFNHNNKAYRELIYRAPDGHSTFTSHPIRPRPIPPVMTTALDAATTNRTGTFYIQNVYDSIHPIPPGAIHHIRINQLFNQPTPRVPHRGWVMDEVPKGVLGTIPVDKNGAASFTIPSRTPVQLQLLDAEKKCVMNMRSFIYLQDGEHASCVGCHDDRMKSPLPVNYATLAPATPTPIPGPDARNGLNYAATVQPILDRHCITCHGLTGKPKGGIDLTGTYIERDPGRYPGGTLRMSQSYHTLVTNPKYYKMLDRNLETNHTTPGDYLSPASGLPDWLKKHSKEQKFTLDPDSWERIITWLDVNAQMYGNYSFNRPEDRHPDPDGEKRLRDHIKQTLSEELSTQPYATLVNNADIDESRILKLPLAQAAGGWAQTTPHWQTTGDPAYQAMRQKVINSLQPLQHQDTDGTCGNPAKCRCASCWVKETDKTWAQNQQ